MKRWIHAATETKPDVMEILPFLESKLTDAVNSSRNRDELQLNINEMHVDPVNIDVNSMLYKGFDFYSLGDNVLVSTTGDQLAIHVILQKVKDSLCNRFGFDIMLFNWNDHGSSQYYLVLGIGSELAGWRANVAQDQSAADWDGGDDASYISYDDAEYEMGFMDIENDVIDELGLYIDFSAVRGDYGTIWIFSDPEHENNADMWMGDLDDALVELDFSEYTSGIESEVLTEDKTKWKDLYTKYLESLIRGGNL